MSYSQHKNANIAEEISQVNNILGDMQTHVAKTVQYRKPQSIVDSINRPEMCKYGHIRFFGRYFPAELTHN